MRKIHSHDSAWVSAPPMIRPNAAPPAETAAHADRAWARSRAEVNAVVTTASAAGEANAAPSPCSARAAISISSFWASALSSEAVVNSAMPPRNVRLWPNRSAARPPSRRNPPKASV